VPIVSRTSTTTLDEVGTALVRAAGDLLAREGATALTVRAIASAAGTSTMNVYSRFGGKDGVVEQLWLRGFDLLAEAMSEAGTTDDPIEDLRRCGLAYRRFALDHTTLYNVMFTRAVPDFEPGEHARERGLRTLEELARKLERAMDAGLLRRIDPDHAAAMVWATCHGAVSLELTHAGATTIDWEHVFADTTEAVVKGLAT